MAGDTDKAVPPAPMPQDKGRWPVAPAPDGRGMPEEHKPPAPHRLRGFWILVGVLLVINWVTLLMAQPSGPPRVKVPFNPYFLQQVQGGQVKSISSRGDTIEGTFAKEVVYPPGSGTAKPTTLFSTQVPTFWNNATDSLEKILLGAPRGIILSRQDRERTAYHESGHALVRMLTRRPIRCARCRSSPHSIGPVGA